MSAELSATLVERRPQSLVITLLGAYVYPDDRLVWSGGLVQLLGELGFSPGAARIRVRASSQSGELSMPDSQGCQISTSPSLPRVRSRYRYACQPASFGASSSRNAVARARSADRW